MANYKNNYNGIGIQAKIWSFVCSVVWILSRLTPTPLARRVPGKGERRGASEGWVSHLDHPARPHPHPAQARPRPKPPAWSNEPSARDDHLSVSKRSEGSPPPRSASPRPSCGWHHLFSTQQLLRRNPPPPPWPCPKTLFTLHPPPPFSLPYSLVKSMPLHVQRLPLTRQAACLSSVPQALLHWYSETCNVQNCADTGKKISVPLSLFYVNHKAREGVQRELHECVCV